MKKNTNVFFFIVLFLGENNMKKFLPIFIIVILFLLSISVHAEREYVGETFIKDNMLFINGNSIPAAQLPNEFVYVRVDDLDDYGFDVYMSLWGEGEDNVKKIYTVKRNEKKGIRSEEVPSSLDVLNVYKTDAEVYIDSDIPANVFELEDGTVLVQSDEFAKYGGYDWNIETHQIHIDFKQSFSRLPFMTFQNVIGVDDINEITSGVIVNNTEKKCADIDYDDLMEWLKVYWNFNYERVIAPLSAFDISGNYVKFWNKDKSKSYIVYSNGGIICGKYGKPYETHGEIKQNYVWYLPVISNSRGGLNSADMTLNFTYFREIPEVSYKGKNQREYTQNDDIEITKDNLLNLNGASEWADPEIEKAAACNLMIYELSDKYVQPITRLEFCQLIYRLIATEFYPNTDSRQGIGIAMENIVLEKGISKGNENKFTDCLDTRVNTLVSMGIIHGMGDGIFAPDECITREQAATILNRTAEFLGNKTLINLSNNKIYEDEKNISDWAISAVARMKGMNIMKGVSEKEFAPKQTYTVEQAIATMLRLYECG